MDDLLLAAPIWFCILTKLLVLSCVRSLLCGNYSLLCLTDYRKRITSGETTLKELASTESDCSSARKEGDLGFFGPGQMQSKTILFLSPITLMCSLPW